MTALENVELPMILDGRLSHREINARARSLLEHFGLGKRLTHLPSQMSGGEQQRVTIARAIANRPALMLLDEPTGDLDSKNSHIVLDILVDLNRKERITCVFVTHDVALKYFAHRVIHMLDGKIARIEQIPAEKREQAERDLKKSLHQVLLLVYVYMCLC
ncbi:ABC transporter family protein, partial [Reticulomyxa filosa]